MPPRSNGAGAWPGVLPGVPTPGVTLHPAPAAQAGAVSEPCCPPLVQDVQPPLSFWSRVSRTRGRRGQPSWFRAEAGTLWWEPLPALPHFLWLHPCPPFLPHPARWSQPLCASTRTTSPPLAPLCPGASMWRCLLGDCEDWLGSTAGGCLTSASRASEALPRVPCLVLLLWLWQTPRLGLDLSLEGSSQPSACASAHCPWLGYGSWQMTWLVYQGPQGGVWSHMCVCVCERGFGWFRLRGVGAGPLGMDGTKRRPGGIWK